jgi:beta-glucosidase
VIDFTYFLKITVQLLFIGLFLAACSTNQTHSTAPGSTEDSDTPAESTADTSVAGDASVQDASLNQDTSSDASDSTRAEALLGQMTLEEKVDYIGGYQSFYIRSVPRLDIPEIRMSDGPMGCRNYGPSTAYPGGAGLAATFDVDAAEKLGASLGRDCRARGVHILLGPGVNIYRSPLGGRNFEYFGEDPLLAGKIAAAFIRGVQSQGVVATVKHFAANNQEWDRNNISSEVDERALREIYFPAFERAVKEGNAGAVMTAYNLLNGTYCSHHSWLINDVLKGDWAFGGMVMSDWGAVHDAAAAFDGGCDLEMPEGTYMNRETLLPLLEDGTLDESDLDDKVRRILRTIIAAGFLDREQTLEDIPLDDPNSRKTALDTARQSIVLLKNNNGFLPLNRAEIGRIAVIGPNATPAVTGGGGSSYVTPNRTVSLLDGLMKIAPDVEISYHPGVQWTDDTQAAADTEREISALAASADAVVVAVGFGQSANTNSLNEAFAPDWPPQWATLGLAETEGFDHPFDLPPEQIRTVALVAEANLNLVVVVNAGGAVNLNEIIDRAPALLWAWYPGQEGGAAVAETIFGEVNPSGKLPMTFGINYEDYPSAPYYQINDSQRTPYTEGIFVGYRGFDKNNTVPLFPFGFGLSYTRFEYSDLSISSSADGGREVSLTVKNIGDVEGAEVIEVYLSKLSSSVPRPNKELAGFIRMSLMPDESRRVTIPVEARSFAYWDIPSHSWIIEPGKYAILAASSSSDIRLTTTVEHSGDLKYRPRL